MNILPLGDVEQGQVVTRQGTGQLFTLQEEQGELRALFKAGYSPRVQTSKGSKQTCQRSSADHQLDSGDP